MLSVTFMKILIISCIAVTLGCHIGSFSSVRPHARRADCQANLKRIGAALIDYVQRHGQLPHGRNGDASLVDVLQDPQVQKELGISSKVLQCPADTSPVRSSYMFNPTLTANDFRSDSTTVVACDRQPFHPNPSCPADSPASVILLGSGAVTTVYLPPKARDRWATLFLEGDPRACTYSADGNLYTGDASIK
jgi:hypothetical protein